MTILLEYLKKMPWFGWLIVAVLMLFLANQASSYFQGRSLYNIALDSIRTDQTRVVRTLEETLTNREKEIAELEKQVLEIQRKGALAEKASADLRRLIDEKDKQIMALQKERDSITIPTDINKLADEFRKRGYSPRVVVP